MFKDCGRDGPGTVLRRVFSGKGPDELSDSDFIFARVDDRGSFFRFHHPGDRLGNGTEVLSNCANSNRFVASGEVSAADSEGEDLEVVGGPLDPSESAFDVMLVAEGFPSRPGRGLVTSGACNH